MKMPGEDDRYEVFYHPLVVEKDIPALPQKIKTRIKRAIEQRLATKPTHYGKPLRYSLKGHRRIRVGEWRIVFRIENRGKKVIVLIICHRKNVYSHVGKRIEEQR